MLPEVKGKRMILAEKEFRAVVGRGVQFIKKFSRDMEAMNIAVKPRDCNRFCPYSAVCRIDKWQIPEILEEILEEDEKSLV